MPQSSAYNFISRGVSDQHQQDGKTAWACYVQEEDLDIQGRLLDNTPITLGEFYAMVRGLAVACWTTDHYHVSSNLLFYETKVSMPPKAKRMRYDAAFELKVMKCAFLDGDQYKIQLTRES